MSSSPKSQDVARFVALRKELTQLRSGVIENDEPLTQTQRDVVALAQAEALCDLAAVLNGYISVSVD